MERNRLTEDDQEAPCDGGAGTAPAERQVIVICEECGKKYSVVPSRIQGSAAGFTCRRCGHRIVVAKPPEALPGGPAPPAGAAVEDAAPPRSHRTSLGLRAEMVGIVVVFPLLVMAGAAFFFRDRRLHPGGSDLRRADPRQGVSASPPCSWCWFSACGWRDGSDAGRCGARISTGDLTAESKRDPATNHSGRGGGAPGKTCTARADEAADMIIVIPKRASDCCNSASMCGYRALPGEIGCWHSAQADGRGRDFSTGRSLDGAKPGRPHRP
jgi:DNA-directed RNA polymerase subunit RPC12/RpoP